MIIIERYLPHNIRQELREPIEIISISRAEYYGNNIPYKYVLHDDIFYGISDTILALIISECKEIKIRPATEAEIAAVKYKFSETIRIYNNR